jgi:cytochrome c
MGYRAVFLACMAAAGLAACGDGSGPVAPEPEQPAMEQPVAPPEPLDETSAQIDQGRTIAEMNCAGCHSLDPQAPFVEGEPPPMRDMLLRYDAEVLTEDLIDGIRVGHQDMPEFDLSVTGADALVAFLKSIRPAPGDGGDIPGGTEPPSAGK